MKTIQHIKTLFYYDGPQVFEARDAIGGHYVAVMAEPAGETDRYLVAGVSPESLRRFRSAFPSSPSRTCRIFRTFTTVARLRRKIRWISAFMSAFSRK